MINYSGHISICTQNPITRDPVLLWEASLKDDGTGQGRGKGRKKGGEWVLAGFARSWSEAEWATDFPWGCSVMTKVAWIGYSSLSQPFWGMRWQSVDLIGICVTLWWVAALVITTEARSEELFGVIKRSWCLGESWARNWGIFAGWLISFSDASQVPMKRQQCILRRTTPNSVSGYEDG